MVGQDYIPSAGKEFSRGILPLFCDIDDFRLLFERSGKSRCLSAVNPYGMNKPSAVNGNISYISRGPNNQAVPTSLMRMEMLQYFVNAAGVLIRRAFGLGGRATPTAPSPRM